MKKQADDLKAFIKKGDKKFLRHLSIDCVIFGYHEHQLKVLLLQWKQGQWSLPGGFIRLQEDLHDAARRILQERTGLKELFLQQFCSFGHPERTYRPHEEVEQFAAITGIRLPKDHWLLARTITIGYYAVTEYSKVTPLADSLSTECTWRDINEIPRLIFDHNLIITEALKAMRLHIYHQPIGYNLLPSKFTLPEIHDLYETILGKELDRRNFAKKLISAGIIKKLNEQRPIGPHRSPYLYTFDKRQYVKSLKEGMVLVF